MTFETPKARWYFPTSFPAVPASLLLLTAAFLWGSGNLANKTILLDVDPTRACLLRATIAATVLLLPALRERVFQGPPGWLRSVAPGSLMFALALLVQQWGYQTATVTNASFLVNVTCVLTPLLCFFFWQDRLQSRTVICAVVVLVGALLMSGAFRSLASVNIGDFIA